MFENFLIPADVPQNMHDEFVKNYKLITKDLNRLILFAVDHKIEHLNKDFYDTGLDNSLADPKYLFKIASRKNIGAFATQLGLIARYGAEFPEINFIVKLNSKTDIIPKDKRDPISNRLWTVDEVVKLKKQSNLSICGVGYTVYLGSEFEHIMLSQAAEIVLQAHQHGLIATLWMYPRGKYVTEERDFKIIAGAAGVANCLGADFAKINPPNDEALYSSAELLQVAVQAAGNTKLICSGGKHIKPEKFLEELHNQLHVGGISGCATGRNIYQNTEEDAIRFTKALYSLVYENSSLEKALSYLKLE